MPHYTIAVSRSKKYLWGTLRLTMADGTNEIVNGVIQTKPLRMTDTFIGPAGGKLSQATIGDYWQWAYSDIIGNTDRGALAEFIVARALGTTAQVRNGWAPYDLETPTEIRVEVKSSAYLQSWFQKRPSSPGFGIRKTLAWDPATNEYDREKRRHADVYVFCLLAHQEDKATLNPLDLAQWEFYVVATSELDRAFGERGGVSISKVRELSPAYSVDEIAVAVSTAYARST